MLGAPTHREAHARSGWVSDGSRGGARYHPDMADVPDAKSHAKSHTNRLAGETSPYLLQHAHNPVDWFPWGPDALARAKLLDRPVFLSVGYAACHWCHVMERESFEDPATAALLNSHFVAIKVDREERPDIDQLYMGAVQAMTGQGGWPMSVFLTPDGRPFYGGTYFPDTPRHGMPAFSQVLEGVRRAWIDQRAEIERSGVRLVEAMLQAQRPDPGPGRGGTPTGRRARRGRHAHRRGVRSGARWLGVGAQVPAADDDRAPAPPACGDRRGSVALDRAPEPGGDGGRRRA